MSLTKNQVSGSAKRPIILLEAFKLIPIKEYRKCDLRVLLMNPKVDLKDDLAVSKITPMHHEKFRKLLNANLEGRIDQTEWKTVQVLSEPVVRALLNPLSGPVINGRKN